MSQINKLLILATLLFTGSQNIFAPYDHGTPTGLIANLCKSITITNDEGYEESFFNSYYISLITDIPTALLPNESSFVEALNRSDIKNMINNIKNKPELSLICERLAETSIHTQCMEAFFLAKRNTAARAKHNAALAAANKPRCSVM